MHIHILGICGTFMGSLAVLAKQAGYTVSGSDLNVYPPMSTQLEEQGIEITAGYDPASIKMPDLFIVGNAMSRGNPMIEHILNNNLPYTSGPQWLNEAVLSKRWVLGVAGTHGKTTTTAMLTWVLQDCGFEPGYLIGGVPGNFEVSASLGKSDFFVIEADEYDTAFFDKRSKFVHYNLKTVILNNLEFDHADIFKDLEAIQTQFHHLVRTVSGNGLIIKPETEVHLEEVIDKGCWTPQQDFTITEDAKQVAQSEWVALMENGDGSQIAVYQSGKKVAQFTWNMCGKHNVSNAMATIIAAHHVGILPADAAQALARFQGVKRRLEIFYDEHVTLYDDFAHHPTAITTTLQGLCQKVKQANAGRVIAVIEPRSNTMKLGHHKDELGDSALLADHTFWFQPPNIDWALKDVIHQPNQTVVDASLEALIEQVNDFIQPGDHVVFMSNGAFGGIHQKFVEKLQTLQPVE